MSTLIHERVELARAGRNPYVICRVRSGWVVLGDHQFFRGYSLLLPDPVVASPNDLARADRAQQRLSKQYRRMVAKGKHHNTIVVAIARMLVGYLWETLRDAQPVEA